MIYRSATDPHVGMAQNAPHGSMLDRQALRSLRDGMSLDGTVLDLFGVRIRRENLYIFPSQFSCAHLDVNGALMAPPRHLPPADCDVALWPVHTGGPTGGHWSLVALDRRRNTVTLFDSAAPTTPASASPPHSPSRHLEAIFEWLRASGRWPRLEKVDLGRNCPQQARHSADCGVFVALSMLCLSREETPVLGTRDVHNWRRRLVCLLCDERASLGEPLPEPLAPPPPPTADDYRLVGINRRHAVTLNVVAQARRRLAAQWHPDKFSDAPAKIVATRKLGEMNAALDRVRDAGEAPPPAFVFFGPHTVPEPTVTRLYGAGLCTDNSPRAPPLVGGAHRWSWLLVYIAVTLACQPLPPCAPHSRHDGGAVRDRDMLPEDQSVYTSGCLCRCHPQGQPLPPRGHIASCIPAAECTERCDDDNSLMGLHIVCGNSYASADVDGRPWDAPSPEDIDAERRGVTASCGDYAAPSLGRYHHPPNSRHGGGAVRDRDMLPEDQPVYTSGCLYRCYPHGGPCLPRGCCYSILNNRIEELNVFE